MKVRTMYRCLECEDDHTDYHDAMSCCPHVADVFYCGHCSKNFNGDEDGALDCCGDVDEDAPPIISQDELEAAGQQRLQI